MHDDAAVAVEHRCGYRGDMRSTLVLCGSLLLPCACGPDKGGDDTTTSASEASTGTTSGELPTTGGSETAGPGVTGGPDECAPFEDASPSPEVTVILRNSGAEPVFLTHVRDCDDVPPFEMAGPDTDTPVIWTQGMCDTTCGQALAGVCGCPPFCPQDAVMKIYPGGQHTRKWDGALHSAAMLPEACTTDSCGPQCARKLQAAPGAYTLRARAAATASCVDPNMCTCTPNREGWCEVPAASLGPELVEATAQLEYPSMFVTELVFGGP